MRVSFSNEEAVKSTVYLATYTKQKTFDFGLTDQFFQSYFPLGRVRVSKIS